MTKHDFKTSLSVGEKMEKVLDEHYKHKWEVYPVNMTQQKMGIDRIFIEPLMRFRYSVEYKTDFRAPQTGNIFVETWSVCKDERHAGKRGWSLTSLAQVMIYYIPEMKTAYHMAPLTLKHYTLQWLNKNQYPTRKVENKDYFSEGLLVPITDFAKKCYLVEGIGEE